MRAIVAFMMIGVLASLSQATVEVVTSPANPQQTSAVAAYTTSGDDMDGMTVTVNGSATAVWADTGPGAGAAVGSGWSLAESGDTFGGLWTLTATTSLDSLLIDAGAGDTMFDIIDDGTGTPGSANGWPFSLSGTNTYTGDILVTYSGPISLTEEFFYGDLYRYMDIDFSSPFTGTLTFVADTDNARMQGDIYPIIPAPGAVVLASLGLVTVSWLRRWRTI